MTAASATQTALQNLGYVGMALGGGLFIWGITVNGEHWWRRWIGSGDDAPTPLPAPSQTVIHEHHTHNHFYEGAKSAWNKIVPLAFQFHAKGVATESHTLDRAADRDTSLREGLSYAAFGRWGLTFEDAGEGGSERYQAALAKFHQLAKDDDIRVWGISTSHQATALFDRIPASHWGYAEVEYIDALRNKAWSRSKVPGAIDYTDLRVNRAEFEREWPHA